jgi:kelch-like protein 20
MSTRRKHLGCAVFNNLIYAVGGRDDCMELSSAERFNPHTNTWSPIVAMTSRRSGVSIAINYYYYFTLCYYAIQFDNRLHLYK